MTDNRTTELLRKLLNERGVGYFIDDDERAYDEPARTTWDFVLCGYEMTVTATEFVDVEGKTYLEMDFHHAFTPEQAIAATLGSGTKPCYATDRTYEHCKYSVNRGWVENVGHGTLTAEQVRKCVQHVYHEGYSDGSVHRGAHIDETDWQAIADELNAELGCGTCKNIAPEYLDFLCSECGFVHYHSDENDTGDGNDWAFCPRCGKAVER